MLFRSGDGVKATLADLGARSVAGGIVGGASAGAVDPEHAAIGAGIGMVAPGIFSFGGMLFNAAGNIIGPQTQAAINNIKGKTLFDVSAGKADDVLQSVDKAKAIYNWVVDNTHRNPKTRGCGQGDVKLMLETNNLGGKCADINAVFVALSRSVGLPARDVYGIRIADSARGYKSLGKSGDITKAQHCRAEFYASGYGWVPVDPADVRKVILEETGGLAVTDPKVIAIRDYLFGNWEMNWMAYNYDHDITLPGSKLGSKGEIPFLMYPQAENTEGRFDSLDPDNFKYKITSVCTDITISMKFP